MEGQWVAVKEGTEKGGTEKGSCKRGCWFKGVVGAAGCLVLVVFACAALAVFATLGADVTGPAPEIDVYQGAEAEPTLDWDWQEVDTGR